MAEVIAAVRAESAAELQYQVKLLTAELSTLKAVLSELRLTIADRKTKGELEAVPLTRHELN